MNTERLQQIYASKNYSMLPIEVGQTIEIHEKVWEWNNQRIWKFRGLVLKTQKPNNPDGTFTVRGKVAWVVVEKIYPLSFPKFEKVELIDEAKLRKAKLYYIREKIWKDAKLKSIIKDNRRGINLVAHSKKFALKNVQPESTVAQEQTAE